jgi:endothelin-converting enzyme/putative endopeptidase
MAQNPLPPDKGDYDKGERLQIINDYLLKDILEAASVESAKRTPVEKEIGDYFAACLDEKGIDQRGIDVLKSEFDRIDKLKDKSELAAEVAHLHSVLYNLAPQNNSGGSVPMFQFSSSQDLDDAQKVVAAVDQAALGLPDRDYYLRTDADTVKQRQKYVEHVQKMFGLLGDAPDKAQAEAKVVMDLETELAKGSMDLVKRRDPANLNHKLSQAELEKLMPNFNWKVYLQETKPPKTAHFLVATPDFLKALDAQIQARSLDDWKTYLRWHLVHSSAALLPTPFLQETFALYGKEFEGAKDLPPRWRRCAVATDRDLGEALGEVYAQKAFGAQSKKRMSVLVADLKKALGEDIDSLDWMSVVTKKAAKIKLAGILDKIGYPDKPRDYSKLRLNRTDALANAFSAGEFEFRRQLTKIGKPVDRLEWAMTAPTVNAYYDPQMNTINFPAGILQPPYFDNAMDDAVNYGDIGSVIGHEMTHGFDDQGRKFDSKGNLKDWWTADDGKKFDERAACVADEYSSFEALPGLKVDGKLTLGENTADNGGIRIALRAFHNRLAAQKKKPTVDDDKRFFLSYAQGWCDNVTDNSLRTLVQTNPHSPSRFRVNGVLQNLPEFQQAFSCKAGVPMVSAKPCRVW